MGEQLAGTNTDVVLVTEGGVFKGTSTAGTDLDTTYNVICDSPADFEHAYQMASKAFDTSMRQLPFSTKKPGLSVGFYDRTTEKTYHRTETGGYKAHTDGSLENGKIVKTVRHHEKGVVITTPNTRVLFRKPKELEGESVRIGISPNAGEIQQLLGKPDQSLSTHDAPNDTVPDDGWL
jgi:hypothetical protein